MWSSEAWSAVIFAYVGVLALGIVCECIRMRRQRLAREKARAEQQRRFDDVIGFR